MSPGEGAVLLECAVLGFQKYVPSEHPEVPTGNLTTEGYKRSHPVPRNHLLRTTRGEGRVIANLIYTP